MALRKSSFASNLGNTAEKIGGTVGSMLGTIRSTGKQVASISEDALDSAKGAGRQVRRLANDAQATGSELAHQASVLAIRARHELQKTRLRARLFIAEKPATAVAVVAGTAFVGGFLLGIRSRRK